MALLVLRVRSRARHRGRAAVAAGQTSECTSSQCARGQARRMVRRPLFRDSEAHDPRATLTTQPTPVVRLIGLGGPRCTSFFGWCSESCC